jgi:hypothetical protein
MSADELLKLVREFGAAEWSRGLAFTEGANLDAVKKSAAAFRAVEAEVKRLHFDAKQLRQRVKALVDA